MKPCAKLSGWALALAHVCSGDPATIAGYLSDSDVFDDAIVKFATAYAEQTENDYQAMLPALLKAASKRPASDVGAHRLTLLATLGPGREVEEA